MQGSFTCTLSIPLSTSKPWIWSLHQPRIISYFLIMAFVHCGDLSTTWRPQAARRRQRPDAQEVTWVGVLFTGWRQWLLLAHVHTWTLANII
jgi:hypothetical protein